MARSITIPGLAPIYNEARSRLIRMAGYGGMSRSRQEGFYARLTTGTSPYSWVEVIDMYGTWVDGPRSGTTNAYEVNGSAGLSAKRTWLHPSPGGTWLFQYVRSGTTGTGPITISTPSCACAATPAVLTMTSSNSTCDGGTFQSDIIRYGTTPAWAVSGLAFGPHIWISDNSHLDSVSGDYFYYTFDCSSGFYALGRIYQTSVYGSPFQDTTRFSWPVPFSGNSCSPFLLTNGNRALGSTCPANVVNISG